MTIQTLLILFSLISYPSVPLTTSLRATDLSDEALAKSDGSVVISNSKAGQIHWQKYSFMQWQYPTALSLDKSNQDQEPIDYFPSAQTNKDSNSTSPILISPSYARGYMLLPCLGFLLLPVGFLTTTFLTIPAHIYVHDSFEKTFAIIAGKTVFLGIFIYGAISYFGNVAYSLGCAAGEGNCKDVNLSNSGDAAIFGLFGWAAFYIYEIVDAPLAAKRYNDEKLKQQQGFYVAPYAFKDQYRLNVGYRF